MNIIGMTAMAPHTSSTNESSSMTSATAVQPPTKRKRSSSACQGGAGRRRVPTSSCGEAATLGLARGEGGARGKGGEGRGAGVETRLGCSADAATREGTPQSELCRGGRKTSESWGPGKQVSWKEGQKEERGGGVGQGEARDLSSRELGLLVRLCCGEQVLETVEAGEVQSDEGADDGDRDAHAGDGLPATRHTNTHTNTMNTRRPRRKVHAGRYVRRRQAVAGGLPRMWRSAWREWAVSRGSALALLRAQRRHEPRRSRGGRPAARCRVRCRP